MDLGFAKDNKKSNIKKIKSNQQHTLKIKYLQKF